MTHSRTVTICNKKGLHARASAKFVAEAAKFKAQVKIARDGEEVQADSIMELLMLGAGYGVDILISANGEDAEQAIESLGALVCCGFNEPD